MKKIKFANQNPPEIKRIVSFYHLFFIMVLMCFKIFKDSELDFYQVFVCPVYDTLYGLVANSGRRKRCMILVRLFQFCHSSCPAFELSIFSLPHGIASRAGIWKTRKNRYCFSDLNSLLRATNGPFIKPTERETCVAHFNQKSPSIIMKKISASYQLISEFFCHKISIYLR